MTFRNDKRCLRTCVIFIVINVFPSYLGAADGQSSSLCHVFDVQEAAQQGDAAAPQERPENGTVAADSIAEAPAEKPWSLPRTSAEILG